MPKLPGRKAVKTPRTQVQRSQETSEALIHAAQGLFASKGFADTSIDEIVGAAGITRGALYHHFETKTDLFRLVFERSEAALMAAVAKASMGKTDPWLAVCAGCEAFLDACRSPGVQRIILIDAPSVIGWEAMREVKSRHALALLESGLEAAMAAGKLAKRPVRPLAHLLLGALSESAMAIARSPDQAGMLRATRKEIALLLGGLAVRR